MTLDVFRRAAGVSSRTIDGRAVVVVMPRETLHSLNSSGTFLWDAIGQAELTRDQLRDELATRFSLDQAQASEDVDRFLDQLVELGALEVRRDG